ncbi:MAG: hypothetical protein WBP81_38080, partial [Solirubrobacteraceae bacterium]
LRVCGAYEDSALVANGWAQGQGVGRQVRALQAATADGVSLYVRPEPGNAAEVSLIAQSLERLRELSGPGGVLILDSACGHPKTLCEIARADLRFIVPLRAQTGFRERFLTDIGDRGLRALRYVSQREQSIPPELRTRYRGALRDWELTDPESGETRRFRVAYIHSSEEHRESAAARERALSKAEEQLQRVKNGLGGRYYKTRKQVEQRVARIIAPNIEGLISTTTATRNGKPTLTFTRNQDAIDAAARTDGIYALATNLPATRLTAGQLPTTRLQRPADRRTPPPRHQADTQSPPDLPPHRRPHLRAHQHHRNRATDLRANRNRATQTTARERAAARAAAREPRRETHRPQRALNLPRTRPHSHPHRHRARPPHPHPTPHPRTTPDHATLARTKPGRTSTFVVRKMGLVQDEPLASREGAVLVAGDRRGTWVARPEQNGSFVGASRGLALRQEYNRPGSNSAPVGLEGGGCPAVRAKRGALPGERDACPITKAGAAQAWHRWCRRRSRLTVGVNRCAFVWPRGAGRRFRQDVVVFR